MRVVALIFVVGWIGFWIYWFVAARSKKHGRIPWAREVPIRILIVAGAIVAARFGAFRHHGLNRDPWRAAVGLALWALGLSLAIWARRTLGRNWGTPMSQKSDPDLVTTGPYRLVRHPIYTGILLAAVGTATALNWWFLVVVGMAGTYFIYSATVEEQWLTRQFPDTYPAYRHATKMLIPYVF